MKVLLVKCMTIPYFLSCQRLFLDLFHGITSDTVNSAREALAKLEKKSYDVIVSGFHDMPFI